MRYLAEVTFITGNQHKADYLAKWLGEPMPHKKLDLPEIQSFDLHEVAGHKARQAYEKIGKPVLVEDVALTFHGLGRLPGTFIKWFLEELGPTGLCQLMSHIDDKSATASIAYALYDGESMKFFDASMFGKVAAEPKGENGFGWNSMFIPSGHTKTYAEMTDEEVKPYNFRAIAVQKLKDYLQSA